MVHPNHYSLIEIQMFQSESGQLSSVVGAHKVVSLSLMSMGLKGSCLLLGFLQYFPVQSKKSYICSIVEHSDGEIAALEKTCFPLLFSVFSFLSLFPKEHKVGLQTEFLNLMNNWIREMPSLSKKAAI